MLPWESDWLAQNIQNISIQNFDWYELACVVDWMSEQQRDYRVGRAALPALETPGDQPFVVLFTSKQNDNSYLMSGETLQNYGNNLLNWFFIKSRILTEP